MKLFAYALIGVVISALLVVIIPELLFLVFDVNQRMIEVLRYASIPLAVAAAIGLSMWLDKHEGEDW